MRGTVAKRIRQMAAKVDSDKVKKPTTKRYQAFEPYRVVCRTLKQLHNGKARR